MSFEANMEKLFRLMFEKMATGIVSHGVVKSVDKTKDTCTLTIEDDGELINVRLKAVLDSNTNKIVAYPKVGSSLLYVLIENKNTEAFVFAMSEVEEVYVKIGSQKILLNADEIVFNDGLNGGLIKIEILTSKVNALVNTVNALVTAHNSHIHITTATVGLGSAGTIAPTTSQAQQAQQLQKSDYENTTIKH